MSKQFQSFHDILNDLLGQLKQHLLLNAAEVMRKLLIADLLLVDARLWNFQQEGREGATLEFIAFVEIAEDVADARHAEEVVEFEDLFSLQVPLESWVDDVCWLAVWSEELSFEVSLSDLFVEGVGEAIVKSADLLILSFAYLVELAVSEFWFTDLFDIVSLAISKLGSCEVVSPSKSWIFLIKILWREAPQKVFIENNVILDEIEGKHQGLHATNLCLSQLNLINSLW
jgi:hypothetical protein